MLIVSYSIFDDVTLCKHVTSEENAFFMFVSFSYTIKHVILAINIDIAQIAISITSLPSVGLTSDSLTVPT